MNKITIFLVSFSILLFSGCNNKKENKQTNKAPIKASKENIQNKNEITLHSVNGKNITFIKKNNILKVKGNKNKVILLTFFATWCPPCKAEIPHLINLQNKYKNKLKIISVLLEDGKSDNEISSFIKYNSINYIVTNGEKNFELSNLLGTIQNIPFMILYNSNGKAITHYLGAIPEEMINSDIKKAIKQ